MIVATASEAAAASIVLNGSFESLNGSFVDTGFGYMELAQGSTFLTDWTVSASIPGGIVLGQTETADGQSASQGTYFVDLSGYGGNSFNGTLQQQLTTVIGQTYSVSLDLMSFNDGAVVVTIGSAPLTLTAGSPFLVGTTSWTPYAASFTASTTSPLLTIGHTSGGPNLLFVDNVSITSDTSSAVPEPGSLTLLGTGLAALCTFRRRRGR